jgi:hypothetical protein
MITTKIEPLDRDIALIVDRDLSPAARSRALAEMAREAIDEAQRVNLAALGLPPPFEVFVDGAQTDAMARVRPDGMIVAEFELIVPVLRWIDSQLRLHSPVRSGRYKKSHRLFADGIEADPLRPPSDSEEFAFVPTVAYARMIEPDPRTGRKGISKKAPDGVYHVVAVLARKQFGRVASIAFGWREVAGLKESARERAIKRSKPRDMRQPSIIVKLG